MSSGRLERVRVEDIVIPEVRVSAKFDDEQLAFFKASVDRVGVIQEPVVRKLPDGKYEVIAGAHRGRELAERGVGEILVKVVDVDDRTAIEMNLIENVARGSYDPVEMSRQMNNYLEAGGTVEDLVKLTGHTRNWVEKYLSLVELPPEFQDALSRGALRIGHIEQAFRLDDEREIYDALRTATIHEWPVSVFKNYVDNRIAELEEWRSRREAGMAPPTPPEPRPQLADLAECWGCRRKLMRRDLRLPQICEECWQLLTYCTSQLGEPRQAMQAIYDAVTFKQRYDEWRRHRFEEFEREGRGSPDSIQGTERRRGGER